MELVVNTKKFKTPARVRLLVANAIGNLKLSLVEDDAAEALAKVRAARANLDDVEKHWLFKMPALPEKPTGSHPPKS